MDKASSRRFSGLSPFMINSRHVPVCFEVHARVREGRDLLSRFGHFAAEEDERGRCPGGTGSAMQGTDPFPPSASCSPAPHPARGTGIIKRAVPRAPATY